MRITLTRLSPPETAGVIGEFVTNDDGRLEGGPALKGGKEFTVGVYEWTFYVGDVSASIMRNRCASVLKTGDSAYASLYWPLSAFHVFCF